MRRQIAQTVALLSLLAASMFGVQAPAQAAINCARGTQMDIGYTIRDGDLIRGSASYTSCANRRITSVDIWIRRRNKITGWAKLSQTHVRITGIGTPSQKSFSPKDYGCSNTDDDYWLFDTYVEFHHSSGTTKLNSNDVRVTGCR